MIFKHFRIIAFYFLCFVFSLSTVEAQQQTARYISMSEATKAFYEYLPAGYPEPGKKYPLLIFVHGMGECGQGTTASLPLVLRNGIPKLINNGTFPASFTVNGETFKFIIVSPQFTGFPSVNDINNTINYFLANYAVDINRIYLTGLSMGGGAAWYFPGYNSYFAQRIAATVPICGATDTSINYANNIANANVAVWATHNNGDPTVNVNVTNKLVDLINNRSAPPNPRAKKTIFVSNSHDAWTQTYNPAFKEDGKNVYEWMLQYRRNFTVLPVTGLSFSVQKDIANGALLRWSSITEINLSGYQVQKSNDGRSFRNIAFLQSKGGVNTSYSYADPEQTKETVYYRLLLQDKDGQNSYSDIKSLKRAAEAQLQVYPSPATNSISISGMPAFARTRVRIVSASGQLFRTMETSATTVIQVDITSLPGGKYFVEIEGADQVKRAAFVKIQN